MIKNKEPISSVEILEYIEKKEEKGDLVGFIRKFNELKSKEAIELKEKLNALEVIKLNKEQLIKIIEMLPEDEEDLKKIITDTDLNKDETQKILDTIKEYK